MGLLIGAVALQRVSVPAGSLGVPLLLVVSVGGTAWGLSTGLLRIVASRTLLVGGALALTAFVDIVDLARGADGSLTSLFYLLAIYVPFVTTWSKTDVYTAGRVLDAFSRLMTVVAVVAIAQLVVQLVGLSYSDLLADVVPGNALVKGYNTTYPLVYGSPYVKSNAWVFLEPSFCSQFLGAGLVCRLARGRAGWPAVLMAVGLITTVAGTGMVLAAVGLLLIALGPRAEVLKRLGLPLLAAVVIASVSPLGGSISTRASGGGGGSGSASLRFLQPFQVLGRAWSHDLPTMLFGKGPGASERLIKSISGDSRIQSPVPLKLLYDHGLIAGALLLVAIGACVLVGARCFPLAISLFVAWLILSSALLQPATDLPLWVLTGMIASPWEVRPGARRTHRTALSAVKG